MSLFNTLEVAPPDPILGLGEAFAKDPNPGKINLSVGVYQDDEGTTPVLQSVKRAEQRLWQLETTKSYLPISGAVAFGERVQQLLFGSDHPLIGARRWATLHTPGGTGALRPTPTIGISLIPMTVRPCDMIWTRR